MTSEELLAWRKAKNLTQADLGALLGVSRQTAINWEQGKHPIPDNIALKVMAIVAEADRPISATSGHKAIGWRRMTPEQQRETYEICKQVADRPEGTPWQKMTAREQMAWLELPDMFKQVDHAAGRVRVRDWDL